MNNGIQCLKCDNIIPFERLEILPETLLCVECAKKEKPNKYRGALGFNFKTGGEIMVMTEDFYNKEWKKYNPSFGRGSGVQRMSPKVRIR